MKFLDFLNLCSTINPHGDKKSEEDWELATVKELGNILKRKDI